MPCSDGSLRPWVLQALRSRTDPALFKAVVDVGAGAGAWLNHLKPHTGQARWTAIEIWGPYIHGFALPARYDQVIAGDARKVDLPPADLYILGDVAEHMLPGDAVALWDRTRMVASWLILALPVCYYPQGAWGGNPYEKHVAHWTTGEVLDRFAGITDHATSGGQLEVGAFLAEGDRQPGISRTAARPPAGPLR